MFYLKQIKRQEAQRFITELAIAHNPHSKKPQRLWKALQRQAQTMPEWDDSLDKEGLSKLKKRIGGFYGSKIAIKG